MLAVALITLFVGLNALYVAAEFSAVASRSTRLRQIADEGDAAAASMLKTISDPASLDRYVAAAQLGITLSSLSLGFYGQTFLAPILEPSLVAWGLPAASSSGVAVTLILFLLTSLQVVLGELVPKSLGIGFPEKLARITVLPMRLSVWLFSPLIAIFNGSANLVLHAFGATHETERDKPKTADEIRLLAGESHSGGVLDDVEYELLDRALRLRELHADQVMIPRTRVLAIPSRTPLREALQILSSSPHSRAPVYDRDLDHPIGLIHIKDLMSAVRAQAEEELAEFVRPLPVVPETMSVRHLFRRLQTDHFHMAIVADEYGGTSGIVTIEDLIERIFGDYSDEFDADEGKPFSVLGEKLIFKGSMLIVDFNDWLEASLLSKESNTMAGLVMERTAGFPKPGTEVSLEDEMTLVVEESDDRSVKLLSLQVTEDVLARLREDELI